MSSNTADMIIKFTLQEGKRFEEHHFRSANFKSRNEVKNFFPLCHSVLVEVFPEPELEGDKCPDMVAEIDSGCAVCIEKFFNGFFPKESPVNRFFGEECLVGI